MKGLTFLLLLNIALVSISNTSAAYWTTRKSGNFSGMFQENSETTYLKGKASLLYGNNKGNGRITVLAKAESTWNSYAKATYGITYDTSVGENTEYRGSAYKDYRACTSVTIIGGMIGDAKHISITVKLVYFAGVEYFASVKTKTITTASQNGNTYEICTDGFRLTSNRFLYVETVVDVYTFSGWGAPSSIVNVISRNGNIMLNNWKIQEFISSGPM